MMAIDLGNNLSHVRGWLEKLSHFWSCKANLPSLFEPLLEYSPINHPAFEFELVGSLLMRKSHTCTYIRQKSQLVVKIQISNQIHDTFGPDNKVQFIFTIFFWLFELRVLLRSLNHYQNWGSEVLTACFMRNGTQRHLCC